MAVGLTPWASRRGGREETDPWPEASAPRRPSSHSPVAVLGHAVASSPRWSSLVKLGPCLLCGVSQFRPHYLGAPHRLVVKIRHYHLVPALDPSIPERSSTPALII